MIRRLKIWWWVRGHETALAMRAIGNAEKRQQDLLYPPLPGDTRGGRYKEPEWITEALKDDPRKMNPKETK